MKQDLTTMTISLPLALKLRIDAAAQREFRTKSKFVCLTLDRIIPPMDPPAQVDIEQVIADSKPKPAQIARIRRIAKSAQSPRKEK